MSGENIEVVKRAIDAWNHRDLKAFLEAWHPDAEWRPAFPQGTDGKDTVYRGHEGVSLAWGNVRAAWSEYRLEVEDARMSGEDLVVLGHIYVRGKGSGVEIDSAWSAIVRFRDRKVISAWDWLDHSPALEAAGLEE